MSESDTWGGQGGKVVSVDGIAPCVTENHGVVTAIIVDKEETGVTECEKTE